MAMPQPRTGEMHLAIDVREACRALPAGKGHWTRCFVRELLARDIDVTLLSDAPLTVLPVRHQKHRTIVLPQRGLRWHWATARLLVSDRIITHVVSPTSYVLPRLIGRKIPCIPIVHDLIAFQSAPHDWRATLIERMTLRPVTESAAHLCTVSEATKEDLLRRFPALPQGKVTPIFAGPGLEALRSNVPDNRTILCIGTLCPRKNQLRLIQAYAALPRTLRSQFRLVLAGGRGWRDNGIVAAARATEGVEWRGYLSDGACRRLLETATVLAFPSLYEGFGLTALDAMQHGLPVVTSSRGSLREVAGDGALFVDPESVPSITRGLETLLQDGALRWELAERGRKRAATFSWAATVDLFLSALATIPGRRIAP